MDMRRVRQIKGGLRRTGPVIYWMSRDQRVRDNWALLYAQETALAERQPLFVVFCLVPSFLNATIRQYGFLLDGLSEIEQALSGKNIPFFLLRGRPEREIARLVSRMKAGMLVTDFDPLRIKREWKERVSETVAIPFHEVDAHNIVPCWIASRKAEYGAYTLRPKIRRLLPAFLTPFPHLKRHPFPFTGKKGITDWQSVRKSLAVDRAVPEVMWLKPGERAGRRVLSVFLKKGLSPYSALRNDPSRGGQSGLSPYLHFGHLSAQRVALEVMKSHAPRTSREAFLEELIVRRELSDNFCFYNQDYDRMEGFPGWARRSLDDHRNDRRPYLYSKDQFEQAATHDALWNAAQTEMVYQGRMHGYMRMYWAKKILEWSESPEQAMETAIYLNDRYELDGRDPNGYAGIAWSIGGVHDRAWNEREVFGKIRYMSYNGCRKKFDVNAYIEKADTAANAVAKIRRGS